MKKLLIIFLLLSSFAAYAKDAVATGFGETPEIARSNALAELSYVIYSDVATSLSMTSVSDMDTATQKITKQTDIISELPIIGADIVTDKADDGYKCTARLKSGSAISYEVMLADTEDSVKTLYKQYQASTDDSARYSMLTTIATSIDNFEKLNSVYLYLTDHAYDTLPVTKQEIVIALGKLSEKYPSLNLCASAMADELKKDDVYLYYPMNSGSDEVTEFGEVFRNILAGYIKPVKDITSASYFISTDYTVTDSGMFLTAYLTDADGDTLAVSSKALAPSAYKNYQTAPESVSFEKLLKSGMAQKSDYSVRIATKNGKRAVLYKNGDIVEIFVKANRPSYIYVVGHVMKKKEKYSYLLDLYDTDGGRKFIRYIDGEDMNKWLSLGDFKVVAPYGTEVFQVMGSMADPVDELPPYKYDKVNEIYKISNNPYEEVSMMRALKRIDKSKNATAEDVLIFSSTDR